MKTQKGYLLIVALVLIVIVGFVASILTYMFAGSAAVSGNVSQSNSAFYIATSGLEMAKNDILVNGYGCTQINGLTKYTNAALFDGKFTTTGTANVAVSNLNANINATQNSISLANTSLSSDIAASDSAIPLTNAAIFGNSGSVLIDNEIISYNGKSGNSLVNITRGIAGTTAAAHIGGAVVIAGFTNNGRAWIDSEQITYYGIVGNVLQNVTRGSSNTIATVHSSGAVITQNQCILISEGGVPDLVSPVGKRALMQTLSGQVFSFPGFLMTAMGAFGNVILNGNPFVINPIATFNAPSTYTGYTITTHGTVTINGNGGTKINSASGLVMSSGSPRPSGIGIHGDIIQGYDVDSIGDFFALFFNQNYSQLVSQATSIGNGILINGSGKTQNLAVSGPIAILNGNIVINGSNNTLNIGNASGSVMLIVNGTITINGSGNAINFGNYAGSQVPMILVSNGAYTDNGSNASIFSGLLYVKGNFTLNGNSNLSGSGVVAVEGRSVLNGNGILSFNPSVLNQLGGFLGLYTVTQYKADGAITQELFK